MIEKMKIDIILRSELLTDISLQIHKTEHTTSIQTFLLELLLLVTFALAEIGQDLG